MIELLEDMFIPDLNYRMTIEEVKRHKWTAPFVKKLQEDYRARNSVKALGKGKAVGKGSFTHELRKT